MAKGKARGDRPAEGVADDDRPRHASHVHQLCDRIRLAIGAIIRPPAALGVAVARPVDEKHLRAALEGRSKGMHLIEQVAARTVNEDERDQVSLRSRRQVDAVHAEAADVDQLARIREPRADVSCATLAVGDACEGEGNDEQGG